MIAPLPQNAPCLGAWCFGGKGLLEQRGSQAMAGHVYDSMAALIGDPDYYWFGKLGATVVR